MNRSQIPSAEKVNNLPGTLKLYILFKCVEISKMPCVTYGFREQAVVINGTVQRLCLCLIFFFLLSVGERTFKQVSFLMKFSLIT